MSYLKKEILHRAFTRCFCWSFLFFLLGSFQLLSKTEVSSEGDLKKRADNYFSEEKYEEALPDYSRLLSLYPREPKYNYRYGVCLLLAGNEKSGASTYLENASKDSEMPEEIWYFLGRSYMINNDFLKARDYFVKFKEVANQGKQKKFDVESSLQNCASAIDLSKNRKNIVTLNSSETPVNSFYNSYNFSTAAGRVVKAAEQFLSPIDRNKKTESVMYIGNDRQKAFVSSYGKNGENGKDIYIVSKTPDNQWSIPENLGSVVNSTADEDYPFLDRDGRTLYFSSKGHNSIGGYDIFKTVFDFNTNQWSEPENMGIPINTVGDDLLFVPDLNSSTAIYSTNVESGNKTIAIRKIQLPSGFNEMVVITGVYTPLDQQVRRDARISILNSSGTGIITTVHTDPVSGKYEIVLLPGQSYMIVVEGGGYLPHAEVFDLPSGLTNPQLRQVVKLNKDKEKEEMTLQNYFSSGTSVDEPSKSITRTYSTAIDKSSMIGVKINDQVVYVTPPSDTENKFDNTIDSNGEDEVSSIDTTSADTSEAGMDNKYLPNVKIKRRDKYDPSLERGLSAAQIHQKEEEAERQKEISEDEITPDNKYNDDISNDDLAKIAYNDAHTIEAEADSLRKLETYYRTMANEKKTLAVELDSLSQAKKANTDTSSYLMAQSESSQLSADEFNKKADEIASLAATKETEAKQALSEADDIFNVSKNGGPLASAKTKSSKKTSNRNTGNTSHSPGTKQEIDENKDKPLQPEITNKPDTNLVAVADGKASLENSRNTSSVKAREKAGELKAGNKSERFVTIKTIDGEQLVKVYDKDTIIQPDKKSVSAKNNKAITANTSKINKSKNKKFPENKTDSKQLAISGNTVDTDSNLTKVAVLNPVSEPKKEQAPALKENVTETKKDSILTDVSIAAAKSEPEIEIKKESSQPVVSPEISKTENGKGMEPVFSEKHADAVSDTGMASVTAVNTKPESKKDLTLEQKEAAIKKQDVVSASQKSTAPLAIDNKVAEPTIAERTQVEKTNPVSQDNLTDEKNTNITGPGLPVEIQSANIKDNLKGEVPKSKESLSDKEKFESVNSKPEVKEEAKVLYRQYQTKSNYSKELSTEALNLQDQISKLKSSPKRDSLIRKSNDMSLQSIQEWQDALKLIQEARKIEPGIENKMRISDASASNDVNLKGQPSNVHSLPSGKIGKPEASYKTVSSASSTKKIISNVKSTKLKQPGSVPDGNKPATTTVSGSVKKQEDKSNISQLSTPDKSIFEDTLKLTGEQEIDSLHPDFPEYVALQKDITNKQVETIDVFIEGVNLSKKAVEESEKEKALLDKAEVEKNINKKNKLLNEAAEIREKSDKDEQQSRVKFTVAQQHTREVKDLRKSLADVKGKITITRRPGLNDHLAIEKKNDAVSDISSLNSKESEGIVITEKENQLIHDKESKKTEPEMLAVLPENNDGLRVSEEEINNVNLSKEDAVNFKESIFTNQFSSFYSEIKPIPMNPSLPEGLVFKVQIGAFHKPLPSDVFKGLKPLSAETTRPGWIRYCAGMFKAFEPANIVKREIQKIGYKDAFVVAYYNGKRIELYDAYKMIKDNSNLVAYKEESAKEIALLRSINIPAAATVAVKEQDIDELAFHGVTSIVENNTPSVIIQYAVQVGVYKAGAIPPAIASLHSIVSEKVNANSYRFISGRYSDYSLADSAKQAIIQSGIKDAFVIAYKNGKTVSIEEASALMDKSNTSDAGKLASVKAEQKVSTIIYKVQIGAFQKKITYNKIESYLNIIDKGITQQTDERGLHIFYVGTFGSFREASELRTDVVTKGVSDAFIVALRDGKRIPISDEMKK